MPTGHKPVTACSITYDCIMKFDCSKVDFVYLDVNGKPVLMAELQKLASGCEMFQRLGNDWICSCWKYDLRFQLIDQATGEALSGRSYKLFLGDEVWEGRSDADGMTEKVFDDMASLARIEVFPEDVKSGKSVEAIESAE